MGCCLKKSKKNEAPIAEIDNNNQDEENKNHNETPVPLNAEQAVKKLTPYDEVNSINDYNKERRVHPNQNILDKIEAFSTPPKNQSIF
ncbi:unnamed protein product [Moneuplotes crassus]|uniref:Uncharacterized protein n=1 Tax=Euplotes crassus TaxID=5936 RepID=A0AAD1UHT4_EUPCR|nr:unnamed protein product [Moneuplotes crassus]